MSAFVVVLYLEVGSLMEAAGRENGPRREIPSHTPVFQPISAISNRYSKLLELPVTYTKHTAALRSNRYKFSLSGMLPIPEETAHRKALACRRDANVGVYFGAICSAKFAIFAEGRKGRR